MKQAVISLIDTLGENDYVNVIQVLTVISLIGTLGENDYSVRHSVTHRHLTYRHARRERLQCASSRYSPSSLDPQQSVTVLCCIMLCWLQFADEAHVVGCFDGLVQATYCNKLVSSARALVFRRPRTGHVLQ